MPPHGTLRTAWDKPHAGKAGTSPYAAALAKSWRAPRAHCDHIAAVSAFEAGTFSEAGVEAKATGSGHDRERQISRSCPGRCVCNRV